MSCECNNTQILPTCLTDLIIGTIANHGADVWVYVKNRTINKIHVIEATSSGAGLITIDADDFYKSPGMAYELWATLASATSMRDKLNITIDGQTYTCLQLNFEKVVDDGNLPVAYTSQTLTVL